MPTDSRSLAQAILLGQQARDLQKRGDLSTAAETFRRALQLAPAHPSLLGDYAHLAEQSGDWRAAAHLWTRLMEVRPQTHARIRLAIALMNDGHPTDALKILREIERAAESGQTIFEMGLVEISCLLAIGQHEVALEATRSIKPLAPDNVRLLSRELQAISALGYEEELDNLAADAFRKFPANPRIRAIYGEHCLKSGKNLYDGFDCLPDIRQITIGSKPAYDTDLAGPAWDGRPFNGVLRIVADAGLGDQVLASSMFAELAATGQRCQILCDRRLLPIFQRSFPNLEFLPRDAEGSALASASRDMQHDRRCNALDLGKWFRAAPNHFPSHAGWLQADEHIRAQISHRYDDAWPGLKKIGVSWHSSRAIAGGSKGMELAELAPVLRTPGHAFINLQYGNVQAEIEMLRTDRNVKLETDPLVDANNDLDGLVAQIAALDEVITVSNTTAHLAGALGIPCRVLLPMRRPVLWYWQYRGERTPWYPATRLMRSTQDGNWKDLIGRVATELAIGNNGVA